MPLNRMLAEFDCDRCGRKFHVSLEPAEPIPQGWSQHDCAVDAARGGVGYRADDDQDGLGYSSVVGDLECLCATCTLKQDELEEESMENP